MGTCHDSTAAAATLVAATDLLKVINGIVAVPAPAALPVLAPSASSVKSAGPADDVGASLVSAPGSLCGSAQDDPLEFTVIDPTVLMSQLAK